MMPSIVSDRTSAALMRAAEAPTERDRSFASATEGRASLRGTCGACADACRLMAAERPAPVPDGRRIAEMQERVETVQSRRPFRGCGAPAAATSARAATARDRIDWRGTRRGVGGRDLTLGIHRKEAARPSRPDKCHFRWLFAPHTCRSRYPAAIGSIGWIADLRKPVADR
jgi:hypothetical protein